MSCASVSPPRTVAWPGCTVVGSLNQYEIASFMGVVLSPTHCYLSSSPASPPATELKFYLQIPDGHNQKQTWTEPQICSSHILSLLTFHSLWQAPSVSAFRKRNEKVWNLLEFPITSNWFYVTRKVFIWSPSLTFTVIWSFTIGATARRHFILLLVVIFLQSPG